MLTKASALGHDLDGMQAVAAVLEGFTDLN
jgi:hypothetical protein